MLRLQHQRAIITLQPQQPVLPVQYQHIGQKAKAVTVRFGKGQPRPLVLVIKGHILPQILQRHALQRAGGQVDLVGAVLAQRHILHLGGQQTGRRPAAQRTKFFLVAEQSHNPCSFAN